MNEIRVNETVNMNEEKKEIEKMIVLNNKEYIENSMTVVRLWCFLAGLLDSLRDFILILVVPALAFASTRYIDYNLNFIAGILSLCGIAFEKLAKKCSKNAKSRNDKMNKLIDNITVASPDVETEDSEDVNHTKDSIPKIDY